MVGDHLPSLGKSICPQCDREFQGGEKYCAFCGDRLKTSGKQGHISDTDTNTDTKRKSGRAGRKLDISAERKEVTILFADIVGSYRLIENIDPEEAQKTLNPMLEAMADAVQSHDGAVVQFLGDGIMALFGAPVSLEDHAIAASLAAILIQNIFDTKTSDAAGPNIQVRIGLNSGEAVVGLFGGKKVSTYSAIGEAVHLASRMERAAKPGCIYSTFETVRLTKDRIPFAYVGPVQIKGVREPVQVYEVVRQVQENVVLHEADGKELSRFVGRQRDLVQLGDQLRQVESGTVRCVSITGEAGIGKSRIIREFLKTPAASGCLTLKSYAKSYANKTPYFGIVLMLQKHLAISPVDTADDIRAKVSGRVRELGLDQEDIAAALHYLFDVSEPDHPISSLDPNTRAKQIEHAFTTLMVAESKLRPVILIFEDLHWTDQSSATFISYLMAKTSGSPLLILASYRSGDRNAVHLPEDTLRIEIGPLAAQSAASLVDDVIGDRPDTDQLRTGLVRRCAGNPLFAEEMARAAVEDHALWNAWSQNDSSEFDVEQSLPSTVRAILASRIDSLPNHSKLLLQVAAVIGLSGPVELLASVQGAHQGELNRSIEFLKQKGFLTVKLRQGDAWYVFRHVLVQEVAYSSLLLESRRDIHAAIVDEIERVFPHQLERHSESLANHAFHGENWPKAVAYLRRSGEAAANRNAFHQAVKFYKRALKAARNLPNGTDKVALKIDLLFLLRNAYQPLGDRKQIHAILEEAGKLAEKIADQGRMGWVQSYLTDRLWIDGKYTQSIAAGTRALKIADTSFDLRLRVVTNLPLGLAYHTIGAYRQAVTHFQWNVDEISKGKSTERFGLFVLPLPFSQSFITWSLAELGEFKVSRQVGLNALNFAVEAKHPFSIGYAYLGLGVASLRQGHIKRAIDEFQHALSDQAFAESPVGFSFVALHLGYAYVLDGQPSYGLRLLEKTVTLAEEKGFVARHSLRLAYLSAALLAVNQGDDAVRNGQRAVELARSLGEQANEAFALCILGRAYCQTGSEIKGEHSLRASLRLSESLGLLPLKASCLIELAHLNSNMGKVDDAESYAARGTQLREKMGL